MSESITDHCHLCCGAINPAQERIACETDGVAVHWACLYRVKPKLGALLNRREDRSFRSALDSGISK